MIPIFQKGHMRCMPETVSVFINGSAVEVPIGATVAVAILTGGVSTFRRSVSGEPRGAVCGMGICFECRVTIDGRSQILSCQTECRAEMKVITDDRAKNQ